MLTASRKLPSLIGLTALLAFPSAGLAETSKEATVGFSPSGEGVITLEFNLGDVEEILSAALSVSGGEQDVAGTLGKARLRVTGGAGPTPSHTDVLDLLSLSPRVSFWESSEASALLNVTSIVLGSAWDQDGLFWIAIENASEGMFSTIDLSGVDGTLVVQEPTGISHDRAREEWLKGGRASEPATGPEDAGQDTGSMSETVLFSVVSNPALGTAVFAVSSPRSGVAKFQIFDLQGRRVFHDELRLDAGEVTRFEWPGVDTLGQRVASGVYLVKAQGAGIQETRKVTFLR